MGHEAPACGCLPKFGFSNGMRMEHPNRWYSEGTGTRHSLIEALMNSNPNKAKEVNYSKAANDYWACLLSSPWQKKHSSWHGAYDVSRHVSGPRRVRSQVYSQSFSLFLLLLNFGYIASKSTHWEPFYNLWTCFCNFAGPGIHLATKSQTSKKKVTNWSPK